MKKKTRQTKNWTLGEPIRAVRGRDTGQNGEGRSGHTVRHSHGSRVSWTTGWGPHDPAERAEAGLGAGRELEERRFVQLEAGNMWRGMRETLVTAG